MDGTNDIFIKKYRHKIVDADYHVHKEKDRMMPRYTPFFFMDLDFDGIEELVIVHLSMGDRYHDEFDVYRIVDDKPVLINYPPYKIGNDRMTDYPDFDYRKKTIDCPYPEGPGGLGFEGHKIYGVSKKQKDTVVINGKQHLFNYMEEIQDVKYD